MSSKIDTLQSRMEETKKKIENEGKAAFQEAFAEIFEKFPILDAIRWTQYTPYFNDGDQCIFGVHEAMIRFAHDPSSDVALMPEDEDEGDDGDGFYELYESDQPADKKAVIKAVNKMWNKLGKMDDEIFELVFGDHARITATREGFEVDGFDHD